MTSYAHDGQPIDPFRSRQVPDVAGRFLKERKAHERAASLMWAGVLANMFTDHELGLLDDLGFLSQRDHDLIRQAGRRTAGSASAAPSAEGSGA